MESRKDLRSLNQIELTDYIKEMGEKPFRAKQIYEWMHKHQVQTFEEMTNLPASFRSRLEKECTTRPLKAVRVQESQIDGTKKFLFELEDGNFVESVWMKYHHGNSVCISSQVGCRMGCRFCASTLDGLERNLYPSEMLGQIYEIIRLTNERVSNVVVMGTGEPLDNFEHLLRFIAMLTDESGLHISQRNVTVSTCGIVPRIRELADCNLQITLALSLHAPTDEKRKKLMPIANAYSLSEVMEACRYYFIKTGRRISFEYALVSKVNDNLEEADELIRLVKGMNCHINLIPVNPIKERDYVSSSRERVDAFKNHLEKNKINGTIRREMGRDIDGACGQLRRKHIGSLQELGGK